MDHINWDFSLRALAIACSFVALAVFSYNMLTRRDRINRRTRRVMLWLYGIIMGIAYGMSVAIQRHYAVSPATFWFIFCFIGVVISLMWHPEGDDKTPPNDGSLGQRVLDAFEEAHRYFKEKRNDRKDA